MKKLYLAAVFAAAACMSISATAVTGPPADGLDPGGPLFMSYHLVDNSCAVPVAAVELQHQSATPAENAREAAPRLERAVYVIGATTVGAQRPRETFRNPQLAQNRKLTKMLDCRNSKALARASPTLDDRRA